MSTTNSPDYTPVPKVAAAGLGGAVSILVVFFLGRVGVDLPEEASAALTTLFAFVAGYVMPPRGVNG